MKSLKMTIIYLSVEKNSFDSRVCKLCVEKFSSFAEMQQHMTVDHMQKGDVSI
jgi:hypothetical protein